MAARTMTQPDTTKVILAVAGNFSLTSANLFFTKMEPIFHGILLLIQIAVGAATVIYILKKIRNVRTK